MKKTFILLLLVLFCISNTHAVYAGNIGDDFVPLDENGKELVLDEELYYETGTLQKENVSKEIMPYADQVKYEIWLRAYDNYTYIWASSTAYNVLMDRISTTCRAYYESGKVIGEDVQSLSGSGNIQNCSAVVKVPNNPFNFQAYSALSTHSFYKKGYDSYQKVLTWKR